MFEKTFNEKASFWKNVNICVLSTKEIWKYRSRCRSTSKALH